MDKTYIIDGNFYDVIQLSDGSFFDVEDGFMYDEVDGEPYVDAGKRVGDLNILEMEIYTRDDLVKMVQNIKYIR